MVVQLLGDGLLADAELAAASSGVAVSARLAACFPEAIRALMDATGAPDSLAPSASMLTAPKSLTRTAM